MAEDKQMPPLVGRKPEPNLGSFQVSPRATRCSPNKTTRGQRMMNDDAARKMFHFLGPEKTYPYSSHPCIPTGSLSPSLTHTHTHTHTQILRTSLPAQLEAPERKVRASPQLQGGHSGAGLGFLQLHNDYGIIWGSNHWMLAPWKKNYDQPRQHIKKQRHYFANKGPASQSYGFPRSHVWV